MCSSTAKRRLSGFTQSPAAGSTAIPPSSTFAHSKMRDWTEHATTHGVRTVRVVLRP